jgi:hypothetical protein
LGTEDGEEKEPIKITSKEINTIKSKAIGRFAWENKGHVELVLEELHELIIKKGGKPGFHMDV